MTLTYEQEQTISEAVAAMREGMGQGRSVIAFVDGDDTSHVISESSAHGVMQCIAHLANMLKRDYPELVPTMFAAIVETIRSSDVPTEDGDTGHA